MLIQALAAYADSNKELREAMDNVAWEQKPVPWLIEIGADGRFLSVTSRMDEVTRGKKKVLVSRALSVPRSPVNRNSGEHPLLTADSIEYVLGEGPWTVAKDRQKHADHFAAFVELITKAAKETGNEALRACEAFYSRPEEVTRAREALKEEKGGAIVALSLLQGPLVNCPAVRDYWRRHYDREYEERLGDATGECIISGTVGPIAPTHEKIKGAASLGGQAAGVALMSFDKESFRSYGWEQNQNSPVSPDRAMAYVLALNDLLRMDRKHRKDIAGVAFLFWLRDPDAFDPFSVFDPTVEQKSSVARQEEVESLLNFDRVADPDPNQFYMVGVSGNGGRLRVRYWLDAALPLVKENLRNWHRGLRVANLSGEPLRPVWLWNIEQAIDREGEPPAHKVIALMRRAFEGVPLGGAVLASLLARLRHTSPEEWKQAQLGLLRLCINDVVRVRKEGAEMAEDLDLGQKEPAYLCGRLLAAYDGLQYAASGEVNLTVADRYYALASTDPRIAFPKIEDLGHKHLRKLRRDRMGAAVRIEQQIEELHDALGESAGYKFPSRLSLEDQGRFALGFHHQKAASYAAARAAKQNKSEQSNNEVESKENEE